MKTILVPVDFSENAKNALDCAILFAKKLNMKILLMHNYHIGIPELIKDSIKTFSHREIHGTREEMKNELNLWKNALASAEPLLQCDAVFTEGELCEEMIAVKGDNEFDMVVMGTKGASGLKEVFIGSNTARVIEKIYCPVVAVPEKFCSDNIQKIVFATDFHDSDIESTRFLFQLSGAFDASLTLVHMCDGKIPTRKEDDLSNYFMEQLQKSLPDEKVEIKLLEGEDTYETFNNYITEEGIDLFAISTEDRILTGPLFNQGLTRRFAQHIQIPLLVFHASDIEESEFF